MKFLQLLGKELNEWPQGISAITQDISTSVWGFSSDKALPIVSERGFWYSPAGIDLGMCEIGIDDVTLSSDHATAIVTRADWEAERAKLKADQAVDSLAEERAKLKAPKANGGGWIRHRGGKCPVEAGTLVDVRYRSGKVNEHVKALVDSYMSGSMQTHNAVAWTHIGSANDIMAYRIHKPAEQPAPVSEEAIQVGIDAADAGKLTPIADVKARFSGEDRRLEADGWIRNNGQGCPVDQGAFVEVRHRDGCVYGGIKAGEGMATNWGISNHPEDIIWYRPDFQVYPPSYKTRKALDEAKMIRGGCEDYDPQPVSREMIAKSILHCEPYEWRDRIRELDTQRAGVESTYQRQISEITQERESLVQKLAGKGLALVEVVVQPVEDMSDWRNWKAGDLLEVALRERGHQFRIGEVVRMKQLPDSHGGCIKCESTDSSEWWSLHESELKWHSRPAS